MLRVGPRWGSHRREPRRRQLLGRPVAVARRLCDAAGAGEILVSDLVRSLSRSPELFIDCTEITLKGMSAPTETWRAVTRPNE